MKHTHGRSAAPLRKIVDVRFEGMVAFDVLECGHTDRVTGSSGVTRRRCDACTDYAKRDRERRPRRDEAKEPAKGRPHREA